MTVGCTVLSGFVFRSIFLGVGPWASGVLREGYEWPLYMVLIHLLLRCGVGFGSFIVILCVIVLLQLLPRDEVCRLLLMGLIRVIPELVLGALG